LEIGGLGYLVKGLRLLKFSRCPDILITKPGYPDFPISA